MIKFRTCLAALSMGLISLTAQASAAGGTLVYVGTRDIGQISGGKQGIYAARLDVRTGKLTPLGTMSDVWRVSWLTAHAAKPVLFAAINPGGSTTVSSQLYSFRVDKATGALKEIGHAATGALDTTHMTFDSRSNTLFAASYISGEVTSQEVLADGSPGSVMTHNRHVGRGPMPQQASPHAHAVVLDPSRRYVISPDLGDDRIFVYRFDASTRKLSPADPTFERAVAGTGPRHLVFHPNGRFVYVNTEMGASVRVESWDAKQGRLSLVEELPVWPAGDTSAKSTAEIDIDRNGRHLYLSLRGNQSSLVVFDIDGDTGKLTEKQRLSAGGRGPRNFAIDPSGHWLLVSNGESGTVNVFAIDAKSGELKPTGESIAVPNAASLAFFTG